MNVFLKTVVARLVRTGNLTVTGPDGVSHRFGDGSGDPVHMLVRTRRAERAITLDPTLALPEAFMDEELDIVEGDVLGLLRVVYQNMGPAGSIDTAWTRGLDAVRLAMRRLQQVNTAGRSRKNVAHHYDLSGELYRLFLDRDMQYSCAYFERPDMSLDEAQLAKKRHIASKLKLKPGQNVLDIGSGWGGLGIYLAKCFDADVLGVTLSTEQHMVSTERVRQEGLENHVHFELRDYRDLSERFDRIVSVGMFEHVGVTHYVEFFTKVKQLLADDGVMLLHAIGRMEPPGATNTWLQKYIFPGGYTPALSEVLTAIEKVGLWVTDVEILRLHYAETLRHWRRRFLANRDKIKQMAGYDDRFCRMWEFYLAGCETAFRYMNQMVFQIQIARRQDAVPLTRDYLVDAENGISVGRSMAAE